MPRKPVKPHGITAKVIICMASVAPKKSLPERTSRQSLAEKMKKTEIGIESNSVKFIAIMDVL